jgi:hypothetical protein
MEILGLTFSEAKLLAIAYSYDIATKVRMPPQIAVGCIDGSAINTVPTIIPNTNVDAYYNVIPNGFPGAPTMTPSAMPTMSPSDVITINTKSGKYVYVHVFII